MAGRSRWHNPGGCDPGYSFDGVVARAVADGLDAEHIMVIECSICHHWVLLPENVDTCMCCGYVRLGDEREKAISLAEYWIRQLDGAICGEVRSAEARTCARGWVGGGEDHAQENAQRPRGRDHESSTEAGE